jgi:phosphatidylserine decarboxylase
MNDIAKTNTSIDEPPENRVPPRFNIQSGWLPEVGSPSMLAFFEKVRASPQTAWSPAITALSEFINNDPAILELCNMAFKENANLLAAYPDHTNAPIPTISSLSEFLNGLNSLLTSPPQFIDNALVGLPFSAYVVGIDSTLGATALFRLQSFNEKLSAVLKEYNGYLDTLDSVQYFQIPGQGWLSPAAKSDYHFGNWTTDYPEAPYWKSWNSFFTRDFIDPATARPIADPSSNKTVICPNDGSLFRWRENIAKEDVFWLKDMPYSLNDILSSPIKAQQDLIDQYDLVNQFNQGYLFQTYLNPYNFHRWWCPVNGKILFDPFVIPGAFFSKVKLPDLGGATTASTPYLAEENVRGIIVFETDYGLVCCIPLGMSEVSTLIFDPGLEQGKQVNKGDPMGMFQYGGSSFAIIYQKLPGKTLNFCSADNLPFPQNPPPAANSSGSGEYGTNIGSQIGVWVDQPNVFAGTWIDENENIITVTANGNYLTLSYNNGRGPFNGFSVELSAPVIDANFTDAAADTGVYVASDRSISWSNNTRWFKTS